MRKNDFYIFVPSDLDLYSSLSIVTLVQRHLSTKLEVSTALLFRDIGGTGQTDGQTDGRDTTHNAAPLGGPHNNVFYRAHVIVGPRLL